MQQLQELQSQLLASTRKHSEPCLAPAESPGGVTSVVVNKKQGGQAKNMTPAVITSPPQKDSSTDIMSAMCSDKSADKSNAVSVDTEAANCMPTIGNVGSLLLAQQIAKFRGKT